MRKWAKSLGESLGEALGEALGVGTVPPTTQKTSVILRACSTKRLCSRTVSRIVTTGKSPRYAAPAPMRQWASMGEKKGGTHEAPIL